MAFEPDQMDQMKTLYFSGVMVCLLAAGCATGGTALSVARPDSIAAQIDAARKVTGAMAPVATPAEKYSPVTGRHYSGALEFEPGTGVKLVPVEE